MALNLDKSTLYFLYLNTIMFKKNSLIDCGTNRGIKGDGVYIINKTGRQVDRLTLRASIAAKSYQLLQLVG